MAANPLPDPEGRATDRAEPAWHGLQVEEVGRRLASTRSGLSRTEAARRLASVGPNALSPPRRIPWYRILVDQLRSLVVLLLVVVFALALALGDLLEAAAIGAVLLINTLIGFVTELRARRAMESLSRLQVQGAQVLRDGAVGQIDARDLVPGDVLVLEAGAAVPADGRILEATELSVNEAPLTGESLPVAKDPSPAEGASGATVPLAERTSMVYKGTIVTSGTGLAYVVATGRGTEIGRVSELIQTVEDVPTPLERHLARLGRRLIGLALAAGAGIALMGVAQGRDTWLMVETGIALAIAAIPEGLPVVATIALAVGLRRMARRRALTRSLQAVEGLGSATVICADKTGTLTTGQMAVRRIRTVDHDVTMSEDPGAPTAFVSGSEGAPDPTPGLGRLLEVAILANRAPTPRADDGGTLATVGDPTELALLDMGEAAGMDRRRLLERHPEVGSVPFTSERMLMATFHEDPDGGRSVLVKGAPDRLLAISSRHGAPNRDAELDADDRDRYATWNREMAEQGLRVLALADRRLDPGEATDSSALRDLRFLGLVGISDPPAPRVAETLRLLHSAGIVTVMITGDQARTAEAIAREIGLLDGGEVVSAPDLGAEISPSFFQGDIRVFARVSPRDKLAIVRGLQDRGEVVAMLGDGINDAPAIKQADIGVAMGGRGTDVAKETADLVLQDDRFETVGAAVEEGRVIFANIRKFVFYLFSCNLSEVGVLTLTAFAALPPPLVPLQILWLNLVTDVFPALALAVEPAETGVMNDPPRDPSRAILSRPFVTSIAGYGAVLTASSVAAFLISIRILDLGPVVSSTVAFETLGLSQMAQAFNARQRGPLEFRDILSNRWLVGATILTVTLQLLAVSHPVLNDAISTAPFAQVPWTLVIVCSVIPLVVGQLWKRLRARVRAAAARPTDQAAGR